MGEERRGGRVAELGMCWKLGGVWERVRREGKNGGTRKKKKKKRREK